MCQSTGLFRHLPFHTNSYIHTYMRDFFFERSRFLFPFFGIFENSDSHCLYSPRGVPLDFKDMWYTGITVAQVQVSLPKGKPSTIYQVEGFWSSSLSQQRQKV